MESQAESDEDGDGGGGGPTPGELIAFLRGAPKRRRRAALTAFGVTATLGIAVALFKPPTYSTDVKILVQRNATLKDVAATTRTTQSYESPTKGASEAILRRDNVIGLVHDAKILDRWEADRPSILRFLDSLKERFRGKPSEEDKVRAVVGILEKRLTVQADDMTITIGASWSSATTAFAIVSMAERRFLNSRRSSEVGMISDAIDILEAHLKTEREKLNQAVAELQQLEEAKHAAPASSGSAAPSSASAAKPDKRVPVHVPKSAAAPDPERTKLLEEKRRRIAEIEAERQRQINDLNAQLTTLRGTLTPAHPSIVALERRLEIAKNPHEDVMALKQQVQQLEAELANASPPSPHVDPAPRVPDSVEHDAGTGSAPIVVVARPDDDAETSLAKQKLTNATLKYDDLQSRLRAARIELDVAEAAFKYKYAILTPPEVPRDPKKPSATVIGVAGFIGALLFYFLIPAVLDLLSGRFIAAWQAKKLGIPLLGEVDPPS
ncbi:MAG: hypothetical protein IPL19_19490 [Sandaracinaceae bacterium]|nr:hypothetical protein [Sandaracinaceae bacterium]